MRLKFIFPVYLAIISFAHGSEILRTYVITMDQKEIKKVSRGFFLDGKFIEDGVSWEFSKNAATKTVSRSEFLKGEMIGASQYFSSQSLRNPLRTLLTFLSERDIESKKFVTHYWSLLQTRRGEGADTHEERAEEGVTEEGVR